MTEPTEIEVAWAAGIFEGEGTAMRHSSGNGGRVAVGMTDKDVLEHFNRIFPSPSGVKMERRPPGIKDLYRWERGRGEDVREFYEYVFGFLGERRKGQALLVLVSIDERSERRGPPRRTHCKRGHALTGENLVVDSNGRRCGRCRLDAQRRRNGVVVRGIG